MACTARPDDQARLKDISAVGIDLDGTLIDSAPDLARAANAALAACGLAALPEAQLRGMIGDGIQVLLQRALSAALGAPVEARVLARARPVMLAAYRNGLFERSAVFPGAREALVRWQAAGTPLTCITNKLSSLTLPLLEQSGLRPYFRAVYCADDPAERKPAPVLIQRALTDLAVPARRFLMIGDSTHDLQAAEAAGAAAIAVVYGYGSVQALRATGVPLVRRMDDIVFE